mgnify:CR=1 FL=1
MRTDPMALLPQDAGRGASRRGRQQGAYVKGARAGVANRRTPPRLQSAVTTHGTVRLGQEPTWLVGWDA